MSGISKAILALPMLVLACSSATGPNKNVIHPNIDYRALAETHIKRMESGARWEVDLDRIPQCCIFPRENEIPQSKDTQFNFHIKSTDGHKVRRGKIWVNKNGQITEAFLERENKGA